MPADFALQNLVCPESRPTAQRIKLNLTRSLVHKFSEFGVCNHETWQRLPPRGHCRSETNIRNDGCMIRDTPLVKLRRIVNDIDTDLHIGHYPSGRIHAHVINVR